ncbi:MAG: F0F1 ATP synthase subunit delta [Pseudomonadota bacterium]
MADSVGIVSGVAGRYATALFELAEEKNALDATLADVRSLSAALTEAPDLTDALDDPSISRDQMGKAVAALAAKMGLGEIAANLLGLMASKRRLGALPKALEAFEALAAEKRGEATVEVAAAAPLSEAQVDSLRAAVERAVSKKVHMRVDVDPELIGGLVVKIGSRMIDASVRSKLAALQTAMKEVG